MPLGAFHGTLSVGMPSAFTPPPPAIARARNKDKGAGKACSVFGALSRPGFEADHGRDCTQRKRKTVTARKQLLVVIYLIFLGMGASSPFNGPREAGAEGTHTKKNLSPPWTVVTVFQSSPRRLQGSSTHTGGEHTNKFSCSALLPSSPITSRSHQGPGPRNACFTRYSFVEINHSQKLGCVVTLISNFEAQVRGRDKEASHPNPRLSPINCLICKQHTYLGRYD